MSDDKYSKVLSVCKRAPLYASGFLSDILKWKWQGSNPRSTNVEAENPLVIKVILLNSDCKDHSEYRWW